MKIDRPALAIVGLLGIGLIIAGVIIGHPSSGVEGAYFTQGTGPTAYSGAFAVKKTGLLDASDGNLWLGAGIAVVVVTTLALLLGRSRTGPPRLKRS